MKKIFKYLIAFAALFMFYSCSKNNIVDDEEEHNYGEWIEVAATCKNEGVEGHYHCNDCGKDFNEFFEEIIGGAKKTPAKHNTIHSSGKEATGYVTGSLEYYLCKDCHKYFSDKECTIQIEPEQIEIPRKVLSIKEIKEAQVFNEVATIKATVIGATTNIDGGLIYYILKDQDSNEQILMRGVRDDDVRSNVDTETRSCAKGYSYAPSMLFEVGDIIEAPVKLANNGGTIKSGGGYGLEYLLWQGDDYTKACAKEAAGEWLHKYLKGHTDDVKIDQAKVTKKVSNQDELRGLFYDQDGNGIAGFQNEIICFEGTDANPIKFVTGSINGIEDINREYLYFYYGNASSLDDIKIGAANPVFSNFGNTFSLYSPLSTLLCDQREFETPNFNKPYEFVGKIYAACCSGNSSYYHFVCMSEDDIIDINKTGSHAVIAAKMAKNVFYDYMEEKAKDYGIEIGNPIITAIGTSYVVSPEDLCRILIGAYNTPALQQFYGTYSKQVTIVKKATGQTTTPTVENGPLNNENYKKYITAKYEPIGTKGGSLAGTTAERPYEVMNNISIVKGPGGNVMVCCVCMHRADSVDVSEKPYYNCYQEMGKVFDIMVKKYNGMDTKALEESLLCYSCAGIMIPESGDVDMKYDFFAKDSKYIHFNSEKAAQKIVTASCWKMFTSACFLQIVPEADLDTVATFGSTEENSMVNKAPDLVGGDKLSYRDALYITLLPSSNDTPTFLARCGGEYLIRRMFPLEG